MTPKRWKKIKEAFEAACELRPEERPKYLDLACGDDKELRKQVDVLLASSDAAKTFLEIPAAEADTIFAEFAQKPGKATDVSSTNGGFVSGTILADRYRIVGLLGKGGMGEVYKAEDLKLDQTVALKFLPDQLERNPDALRRFIGEVRIARQVSHPNVCRVFDIGELEGRHYISMEFIDGDDLAILLQRIGRLPSDKASEISRQICFGLHAIHDAGILHRDLKPANVIIDRVGKVRITDFGIAGFDSEFKDEEIRVGTPAYMSPEQIDGKEVTVRSDIYSMGLLIYEIFTGKQAFKADSLDELLEKQRTTAPRNPSTLVENLDPIVEKTINRCLEKDPADRPKGVMEVALSLPGGNPLEAAIAAGETPSPEMVAAAPKEGALKPYVALGLLVSLVLSVCVLMVLNTKFKTHSMAPLTKSPDVLAERSRGIISDLGFDTQGAAEAFGFQTDVSYLDFEKANGFPTGTWERLKTGQPAVTYFWYRQSPRPLGPGLDSVVSESDPPMDVSGMISLKLDPLGRLIRFAAVPMQEAGEGMQPGPEWNSLFEMAGLDLKEFEETDPEWTPPMFATKRFAWKGAFEDFPDWQMRIEAASFEGKPVYFEIVAPWEIPQRDQPVESNQFRTAAGLMMIGVYLVIIVGAIYLAWQNLKNRRGDLKGGLKLSVFIAVLLFASRAMMANHVLTMQGELQVLYEIASVTLLRTFFIFLLYVSLEPFVRRWWSELLISWNRLLAGDLSDPMIGRDFLIGGLCGSGHTLSIYLGSYLRNAITGKPLTITEDLQISALNGTIAPIATALDLTAAAVHTGFTAIFVLLITYVIFRRKWMSKLTLFLLISIVTGLAFVLTQHWIFIVSTIVLAALIVVAIDKAGLVGMISFWIFFYLTWIFPATLDTSKFFFAETLPIVLLAMCVAIYAAYISVGGRSPVNARS